MEIFIQRERQESYKDLDVTHLFTLDFSSQMYK